MIDAGRAQGVSPAGVLQAARERVARAVQLDEDGDFVLSHYVAGLAVECVLRAYKATRSDELYEKHDLRKLARAGGFFDSPLDERQQRVIASLGEVVRRWDNAHRYRDSGSLRKYLTGKRLFSRRGDVLEDSRRAIVNAATVLVTFGVRRWKWPR